MRELQSRGCCLSKLPVLQKIFKGMIAFINYKEISLYCFKIENQSAREADHSAEIIRNLCEQKF